MEGVPGGLVTRGLVFVVIFFLKVLLVREEAARWVEDGGQVCLEFLRGKKVWSRVEK